MVLQPYIPIERGQADLEEEPTRVIVVEARAVREQIAAEMIGLEAETLRSWRKDRKGPPYRKLGSAVVYPVAMLDAWLECQPLVNPL